MLSELATSPLELNWQEKHFDLALATIGYEPRARYIFENLCHRYSAGLALGFEMQHELDYERNRSWYRSNSFSTQDISDESYRSILLNVMKNTAADHKAISVVIDISSITRSRLASALVIFDSFAATMPVEVNFVYSLASFTEPPTVVKPNSHVGPVAPEFAGWWNEPDRPLAAIAGLGYEQDKALGAVEYLQAAEVWTWIPESPIEDYSNALRKANQSLLEGVPLGRQLGYRVHDPFECYSRLESLIYGLSRTHNPVLLPFGPKIFSLCALLAALRHPGVPVWRVSAEGQDNPVNREASGFVYGLSARFSPPGDIA